MRILNFSDGYKASEQPTTGSIPAGTHLMRFPSVEAFLANKGESEATEGDFFFNTSSDRVCVFDGGIWQRFAYVSDVEMFDALKADKVDLEALTVRVGDAEDSITSISNTVDEHSDQITELGVELDGLHAADHAWTGKNSFSKGISIAVGSVAPPATEVVATAPIIKITGTVTEITNLSASGFTLTIGLMGILVNGTDHDVTIQHNAGATNYKFNTGANKAIKLKKGAALLWCFENDLINIVGGSGSGGNYEIDSTVYVYGAAPISINDDGFKVVKIKGSSSNPIIAGNVEAIFNVSTGSSAGLVDGQVVTLVGQDDANPITFQPGSVWKLNGDTTLYKDESLTVMRLSNAWIYISGKVGS